MNKQPNLIIILLVLIVLVIIGIVVTKSLNQAPSDTVTVGDSSFKQDPRTDPGYQIDSGSKLVLLEADPLQPFMSELSIDTLETNLKVALYEKNSTISSVASISGKVTEDNKVLSFSIHIDTDSKEYEVKSKIDGTVISVDAK